MSESPSGKPNITLNLVQILDLGCGILQQIFFKQKEDKAKQVLKDLKRGEKIALGDLTLKAKGGAQEQEKRLPLQLELDYSEFRGPGFSFPVYRTALRAMLERIAMTMRAKKDLNLLTNQQTGGVLIHQPGIIQTGEHINVLVMAVEPGKKGGIVLRLMFVDPDQYKRKDSDEIKDTAG